MRSLIFQLTVLKSTVLSRWEWWLIRLKEFLLFCLKSMMGPDVLTVLNAYANADVRSGGHGCVLWFRDLIDISDQIEDGQDIYVRMPSSELVANAVKSGRSRAKRQIKIFLIVGVLTLVLGGLIFLLVACKKRRQQKEENMTLSSDSVALNKVESEDMELPLLAE